MRADEARFVRRWLESRPQIQKAVFLVWLWFADAEKPVTRNPDGLRPSTPEELRQRLEQELTAEEARKISVIVLDVTKPGEAPG